jgi:hypothetical protein
LTRIFGPKGGGGKLREAGEGYIMRSFINCTSPSTIRVIKTRTIRWTEHVAHMGEMENVYNILVGKPEAKNHLEN